MEHTQATHIKLTNELVDRLKQAMQILTESIEDIAAVMWLPDTRINNLIAVCQVNAGGSFDGSFSLSLAAPDLVTKAFRERVCVLRDDLSSLIDAQVKQYADLRNWKSGYAVPLLLGSSLFGVVSIYKIKYHGIKEDEKRRVDNMARFIVDSLQAQYKSEQIESFYKLAQSTADFTSLQKTLTKIAEVIKDLLRADYIDIYPWNALDEKFEPQFSIIWPHIDRKLPIPKEGGVTYQILRSDVPLEYHREHDAGMFTLLEDELGIESFWGVRMVADDEPIGVLHANYHHRHPIQEQDRELLTTLSRHAAVAIREARLSQRLNYQVNAFKKLAEITTFWKSSQDVSELLQQIVDSAVSVLQADVIEVYEYVQQTNKFKIPPTSAGDLLVRGVDKSEIRADDITYDLIKSNTPRYHSDTKNVTELVKERTEDYEQMVSERFVVREQIVSNAVTVLEAEGQKVGLLFINYRSRQSFPEEQRNLIEAFAAQAAIAILSARKAAQLESARKVTEDIHHELDIHATSQKAITGLAELLHVPQAGLVVFNKRTGVGQLMAEYIDPNCLECVPASQTGGEIPLDNNPSIELVRHTKKPLQIFDAQTDPRMEPVWDIMKRRNTTSIMVVPLFGHYGDLIGTIGLDVVGGTREFTETEADLAQLVANQIAIAYENAKLYEKLETVNRFGNQIAVLPGRATKEKIIKLISDQIVKLVPAQDVTVALYNPAVDEITFEFVIQDGRPINLSSRTLSDPNQRGKTSWIIAEGRSILNKTLGESRDWYLEDDKRKLSPSYTQPSFLGVPMRLHESQVIGALIVSDTQREGVFDESDQQVLEAMANHAAIALDNVALFGQLNRQIEGLATLSEVGQKLTSNPEKRLDEADIIDLIRDAAQSLTACKDMYVAIYGEATTEIRFPLYLDNGQKIDIPSRQLRKQERGKTEEIILSKQPILEYTQEEVAAWYEHPDRQEFTGDRQPKSWLGVPMLLEGRVVGVIAIYDFQKENAYGVLDQQILEAMANHAAIALDNVALFGQLNRQIEGLATLSEVGQKLTSNPEKRLDEADIIDLIRDAAQSLTACKDMYVAIYGEATTEIRFPLYLA